MVGIRGETKMDWSYVGRCQSTSRLLCGDTDDTRTPPSRCAALCSLFLVVLILYLCCFFCFFVVSFAVVTNHDFCIANPLALVRLRLFLTLIMLIMCRHIYTLNFHRPVNMIQITIVCLISAV